MKDYQRIEECIFNINNNNSILWDRDDIDYLIDNVKIYCLQTLFKPRIDKEISISTNRDDIIHHIYWYSSVRLDKWKDDVYILHVGKYVDFYKWLKFLSPVLNPKLGRKS
jgi:hypothetical protein